VLGFKRLTAENWSDPDPVNRHFARISPIAGPVSMEGGDWAREFLAVSVADHVPKEVADLFAVARGAMLYGWFFYPLFRIGEEQLFRLLETPRESDTPNSEAGRRGRASRGRSPICSSAA
jgi:hypothetical protein